MAKRTRTVSLKAVTAEISKIQSQLRTLRRRASPGGKKAIDLNIAKLNKLVRQLKPHKMNTWVVFAGRMKPGARRSKPRRG